MKLKKGSAAAKAYMAKIRAKRKTKTKSKQATFKPLFKKKKAAKKKAISGTVKYKPAAGPNEYEIKELAQQLYKYQTEILNLTKQLKFTNGYKTPKEKKEIRKKITETTKIYEALKKYYFTV